MSHSRLGGSHRFHPDLRTASRVLPKAMVTARSVQLLRWALGWVPGSPDFVEHRVNARASVRMYRPVGAGTLSPALLWIHGGGLLIGTARQDEAALQSMADELGIVVASVEYRLAPEHPYPAALNDCYAALTWLASHGHVDPTRIAIGGGSAGGGLAAATVLAAHARGGPRPCLQLLVYPMLDDRTALKADRDRDYRRMWSNEMNHYGWSSYLGHPPGQAEVDPQAAPGRCTDFAGLPPAWIGVGDLDLFHDESLAYADGLRAAGVRCTTQVVPGAFHAFDALAHTTVAREFRDHQIGALREAFHIATPM